ncbi:MAG TPA: PA domain-containing protein [Flavipsychrobacter sp.]
MRRKLLQSVLGLSLLAIANKADAQIIELMGPRFFVNAPAAQQGTKAFTYSSDVNPSWGRELDSSWLNVEVVKAIDSLACGPLTNNVTDKWVLIYRGTCEFGAKALNAQNKGAKGVIIVNNIPGGPVGMGAGSSGGSVTIPVIMVSDVDGNSMNQALNNGQQVFISLTKWGFGFNDDLAIMPNSEAPGHGSVPLKQMESGSPDAYKFYTGAFVANTGANDQTNVKLKSTLTFTPTGGSASVVYEDSVIVANLTSLDSAIEMFSPRSKSLNTTQTGKYTMTYNVSADNIDENPIDNSVSVSLDVTKNTFCKAPLDANGDPIITGSVRIGAASAFTWGPLFYVNKGGNYADAFRLAITDNDTSEHSLNSTVGNLDIYLLKWVDANTDKIIQSTELTVKGASSKVFTTADSNSKMFTAVVGNPDGTAGRVALEDNSWYWVAVDLPTDVYLGCNRNINYYNRSNTAKFATPSVIEFWAPSFIGTADAMLASGSNLRMVPFGTSEAGSIDIDSSSLSSTRNSVPALALIADPFPISVGNTPSSLIKELSVYPNPAVENITVSIDLEKVSHRADIKIIDAVGRNMQTVKQQDIKQDKVVISTKSLTPGNYYVVFFGDDNTTVVKPFTVSGK